MENYARVVFISISYFLIVLHICLRTLPLTILTIVNLGLLSNSLSECFLPLAINVIIEALNHEKFSEYSLNFLYILIILSFNEGIFIYEYIICRLLLNP